MDTDAIAVPFASRSSSLLIASGYGRLAGWSVWESAGSAAAAQVRFRDSVDVTGTLLGGAKLAASGTDQGPNWDEGIRFHAGVYMEVVAGSVEGTIYIKAD
jgi:hypothetical protein